MHCLNFSSKYEIYIFIQMGHLKLNNIAIFVASFLNDYQKCLG